MKKIHQQYKNDTGSDADNFALYLTECEYTPDYYLVHKDDLQNIVTDMNNRWIWLAGNDYVRWLEKKIDEFTGGDQRKLDILELHKKTNHDLMGVASSHGIAVEGKAKQQIIYAILDAQNNFQ